MAQSGGTLGALLHVSLLALTLTLHSNPNPNPSPNPNPNPNPNSNPNPNPNPDQARSSTSLSPQRRRAQRSRGSLPSCTPCAAHASNPRCSCLASNPRQVLLPSGGPQAGLLFTPALHTCSSHLLFTPALHACSSRLLFTRAIHACSSRPLFTPALHACAMCLATGGGCGCASECRGACGRLDTQRPARCPAAGGVRTRIRTGIPVSTQTLSSPRSPSLRQALSAVACARSY